MAPDVVAAGRFRSGAGGYQLDLSAALHSAPIAITAFNLVTAVTLIVVTSVIGFVMGWLFGAIWNWLHPAE
ncbi:MAG TPA: hypothetical protein VII34_08850 [Pyrinomonadaceae bacterium]